MHRKPEYRALTLNIHKGFSASNLRYTVEALRVVLRDSKCNVVFLQEVSGENSRYHKRIKGWPNTDQLEYLADSVWHHFAYGRNAATPLGHHGNAILSATPIGHVHNEDLSLHRLSQRGLLHVTLEEGTELLNVHLGLFERERNRQLSKLIDYVLYNIPEKAPLILAGDFNDWRLTAHKTLVRELKLFEAFESICGAPARTFPAALPLLHMDRIYYRGLTVASANVLWSHNWRWLSDHSALIASLSGDNYA